jgi:hypothetical protein
VSPESPVRDNILVETSHSPGVPSRRDGRQDSIKFREYSTEYKKYSIEYWEDSIEY